MKIRWCYPLAMALALAPLAGASPAAVTAIDAAAVKQAFAKGMPLLETARYKIHASRRETPGQAEVHTLDTDLIYVLAGNATLVTGGEVVDGHEIAPHEIRGGELRGGEAHELATGDVLVVPNGVPHWFRAVQGPFLYYVVKVTDLEGGK